MQPNDLARARKQKQFRDGLNEVREVFRKYSPQVDEINSVCGPEGCDGEVSSIRIVLYDQDGDATAIVEVMGDFQVGEAIMSLFDLAAMEVT